MSGLLNLIAIIVVFGVLMWIINAYIPMPAGIKSVLNVVVLIIVVLYALDFFGLVSVGLPKINLFK